MTVENSTKGVRPNKPNMDFPLFSHGNGQWDKGNIADSPVTKEFRKLTDGTGIYRRGLTFYALRHTFETVGGEVKDQVAVNAVIGSRQSLIECLCED